MEGLGKGLVFELEAVSCVCWVLVPQDVGQGEGHRSSGHLAVGCVSQNSHIFWGGPEMFKSINLSGLETGEEHAKEELLVAP